MGNRCSRERYPYGNLRIAIANVCVHWDIMNAWKKIRLELGSTSSFPSGSVSRGYLIQLPLDEEDRIDGTALALKPHRATVRRYWSAEPDESGLIVPVEGGWKMRCGGRPDRALLLDGQPVRLGEQVSVLEPDGGVLTFRIAGIR
jgi:hypothetical protein